MKYCIIGTQTNALHASLLAASYGHEVTLFYKPGEAQPIMDPTHGIFHTKNRRLIEDLYGPIIDVSNPVQKCLLKGKVQRPPSKKAKLLAAGRFGRDALAEFLKARLGLRFIEFTGDAQEERTMSDWLERRVGGVLSHHLYNNYAEARWGEETSALSNTLARHHFFSSELAEPIALGGTPDSVVKHISRKVEEECTWIRELPKDLTLENGEWTIKCDSNELRHSGRLLVSVAPHELMRLLTLDQSMRVDLNALNMQDLNIAVLTVEGHHGTHDMHLFDEGFPFFRVCFPYGEKEKAFVHLVNAGVSDVEIINAFNKLGFGSVIVERGIERIVLPHWTPIWTPGCLARHRRVTRTLNEAGITLFGRQGCFSDMTIAEDIEYLNSVLSDPDVEPSELQRLILDPNPRTQDTDIELCRVFR